MNKPLFIVNLEANEKRSFKKWRQVEYHLDDFGIKYDVKLTTKRKKAVDLIRKDKKHKIIIVLSGDGGVNALVEGAMKNDLEKILGVIPAGTANDISRIFDIYRNPDKFYETLLNEEVKEIDVGEVNEHYFLGHASLGFDAATLEERDKRHFLKGKLAYVAAGLRALIRYTSKRMNIKLDGEEIDRTVFFMVVSNIKYYANGMKISPFAEPDDGLLDLCLIEGESNLATLVHNLPLVYSGNHIKSKGVYCSRTKQLEISSQEPVLLQVDGDLVEEADYFKFGLADRRLNMLV
jgi:YegS/Rv2252/BmrU family lipid kinase